MLRISQFFSFFSCRLVPVSVDTRVRGHHSDILSMREGTSSKDFRGPQHETTGCYSEDNTNEYNEK